MVKGRQFEEVSLWQCSKKFTVAVFSRFKENRNFNLRDQIQRAALSIMNNIAEGLERNNSKELRYFLRVAKGSCGEVRSMIHVVQELHILPQEVCNELREESIRISQMLGGFIRSLQKHLPAA